MNAVGISQQSLVFADLNASIRPEAGIRGGAELPPLSEHGHRWAGDKEDLSG